jgi:hypothetical protein
MSRRKRRAPHPILVAIDQKELDGGGVVERRHHRLPGRGRHRVAERAIRSGLCKGLRGGVVGTAASRPSLFAVMALSPMTSTFQSPILVVATLTRPATGSAIAVAPRGERP